MQRLPHPLFHYKELEIREVKEYLAGRNVPVRL